ncbi:hypothetical protein [Fusibacter ferrireducens]|uniref:Uncharacterized protein n=1 Tax=Fusibacter ferrireducens TaxID=2785058 RepID=A0ABR9ZM54_9FIRM|nr:hypothetical protein [Fusibacter ferrireducens]MBF4691552.1 hypothetical protein [Fusibacter ferrireducens]
MIDQYVIHSLYGRGIVKEIKDNYLKLDFEDGAKLKTFLYPDAFESFLTFEDSALQKKALEDLKKVLVMNQIEQEEKDLKSAAYEQKLKEERLEVIKKKRKAAAPKVAKAKVVKSKEVKEKKVRKVKIED